MKNFKELTNYLRMNNISIDPSTLKILKKVKKIPRQLFAYFAFGPTIINFILKNNDNFMVAHYYYRFISSVYGKMPDEEIVRILNLSLGKGSEILNMFSDEKIPKVTEKEDYLKIISFQISQYYRQDVYEAFTHPVLRKDKSYLKDAKNTKTFGESMALAKKGEILYKAGVKAWYDLSDDIKRFVNFASIPEEQAMYEKTLMKMWCYEDFNLIRFLTSLNLDNSDEIHHSIRNILALLHEVENVDEYNALRSNVKNYLAYLLFNDNLALRRKIMLDQINADKEEAYNLGYLRIYSLLTDLAKLMDFDVSLKLTK